MGAPMQPVHKTMPAIRKIPLVPVIMSHFAFVTELARSPTYANLHYQSFLEKDANRD
jgi:hypothetical protein